MDDIKHEVKKLHIGGKIRELRKKAGFVLQDLSDRTGLSKSLLSQIEQGVVSPPIAELLEISKALGANIGFFSLNDDPEARMALVRRRKSRAVDSRYFERQGSGYYYEALAYKKCEKYMELFFVEFKRKKGNYPFSPVRGRNFHIFFSGYWNLDRGARNSCSIQRI